MSRVRVCAPPPPPPTNPFFFRERESACACERYVVATCVRAAGWERECERVRGGDVAPESLCERERVHVNACVYECGGGTLLYARALLAERELHLFGRTLSPALQPPHCTRTSLAHTNTRHAHRQSARSRRHDRYAYTAPAANVLRLSLSIFHHFRRCC